MRTVKVWYLLEPRFVCRQIAHMSEVIQMSDMLFVCSLIDLHKLCACVQFLHTRQPTQIKIICRFCQSICHLQNYLRQLKFTLKQMCHKATNVCGCHELTILYLARLEFTSVYSSTPFPIKATPWRNTLLRYFKTGC